MSGDRGPDQFVQIRTDAYARLRERGLKWRQAALFVWLVVNVRRHTREIGATSVEDITARTGCSWRSVESILGVLVREGAITTEKLARGHTGTITITDEWYELIVWEKPAGGRGRSRASAVANRTDARSGSGGSGRSRGKTDRSRGKTDGSRESAGATSPDAHRREEIGTIYDRSSGVARSDTSATAPAPGGSHPAATDEHEDDGTDGLARALTDALDALAVAFIARGDRTASDRWEGAFTTEAARLGWSTTTIPEGPEVLDDRPARHMTPVEIGQILALIRDAHVIAADGTGGPVPRWAMAELVDAGVDEGQADELDHQGATVDLEEHPFAELDRHHEGAPPVDTTTDTDDLGEPDAIDRALWAAHDEAEALDTPEAWEWFHDEAARLLALDDDTEALA